MPDTRFPESRTDVLVRWMILAFFRWLLRKYGEREAQAFFADVRSISEEEERWAAIPRLHAKPKTNDPGARAQARDWLAEHSATLLFKG